MTIEHSTGSVLICRDAGVVGRTLLARTDLRVRWALTAHEAESVIQQTRCVVCITREALARPVLAACARADRKITTIVLLDPANWSSWREYYEAGATTVLQASAVDQLLGVVADATGVSFRTAARVPFKTEVGFALGDEGGAWTSMNLSSTGIAILEFPPYALGSEVDLAFELEGKRFEFNAIVSQILRVGTQRAVGLAFRDVSPELQANVDDVIRTTQRRARPPSEAEDFDTTFDDSTFMALRSATVEGDKLALMRTLTSDGKVADSERAAPWLVAACNAFTPIEVASVRDPQSAPAWAQDAVVARLRAYQARARAGADAPSDTEMREVFGFCQRLADSAAGSEAATLVQVTNIRAEVLRALYDPDLFHPI